MTKNRPRENADSESKVYCPKGGSLVGGPPYGLVPEDPSDVGLGTHDPVIGCNNLLCPACGYPVRSRLGLVCIEPGLVNQKFCINKSKKNRWISCERTLRHGRMCAIVIGRARPWLRTWMFAFKVIVRTFFTSEWRCAGIPSGIFHAI